MAVDPAFLATLKHIDPAGGAARDVGVKPAGDGLGFDAMLRKATDAVVTPQKAAVHAIQDFTHGADGELHKTMLSVERSEIALKYFVSVRNRCLEAYREIMRMGS